ncbi:MAG: hypothetical protein ABIK90_05805 [candidate division WOR-3 bacterium]
MTLRFFLKKTVFLSLFPFVTFVFLFLIKTGWLLKIFELKDVYKFSPSIARALYLESPPRYPQRLLNLTLEINKTGDDLTKRQENLKTMLQSLNCNFAISECFVRRIMGGGSNCTPGGVTGDLYPPATPQVSQKEIKEEQEEIADLKDYLGFLLDLLEKEKSGSLEEELKTLRAEIAENLKTNIENLVSSTEEIIKKTEENQNLYNQDYLERCRAECKPGAVCQVTACIAFGSGVQKQIGIKVRLGVSFQDLEFDPVSIDKINVVLPDKLNFPNLGDITFKIQPQTVQVCSSLKPVEISAQPPSFPTLPQLNFTCPSFPQIKIPQIPIPKLPHDITIPFPQIPFSDLCKLPNFHISIDTDQLAREYTKILQDELNSALERLQGEINRINDLINQLGEQGENVLNDYRQHLLNIYNIVKEGGSFRTPPPPTSLETEEPPFQYQYDTNQTIESDISGLSLSYQCPQKFPTTTEIETRSGVNWYVAILDWLVDQCKNLIPPVIEKPVTTTPYELHSTTTATSGEISVNEESTTTRTILETPERAPDCFNSESVVGNIIGECIDRWEDYCTIDEFGKRKGEEPPLLCYGVDHECNFRRQAFISQLCNSLTRREGKSKKGPGCENPLRELEIKCDELRDKYYKEPPEECKYLPILGGNWEALAERYYSTSTAGCPGQTLANIPLGLGTGFAFNCPINLNILPPTITLPDIIIPDLILPSFGIKPFFWIKLPRIIIEDIILPDIELCDFNKCAPNILPSLNFKTPTLNLSSFDISAPVNGVANLEMRTRIELEKIHLQLPQLNLFNLLLPEISIPSIDIPKPKIDFAITGIDLSAIFQYIITFVLNALGVPTFSGCLKLSFPTDFLSITFPDYYFSFIKFPPTVKIPYCEKADAFCQKIKDSLGEQGWIEKAKEIEREFNKEIDKIQAELDKVTEATDDIRNTIKEIFQETYSNTIVNAITEQLRKKGLDPRQFFNPQTQQFDLSKIPFPGVFSIAKKTEDGGSEECLPIPLPETKITLKLGNYPKKEVKKISATSYEIYVPLKIPYQIPISWPKSLKEIDLKKLPLNKQLRYEVPKIPLKEISYRKEFTIKGPGFQSRSFSFDFSTNSGDCLMDKPSGGNPLPMAQINANVQWIKNNQEKIKEYSKNLMDILR